MRKAAFCLLAAALMSGCGAAPVRRYFEIRTIGGAEPPCPGSNAGSASSRRLSTPPTTIPASSTG